MPIHAIADGEVIACWRNAPDNLAPGVQHPARAQGLIGGGGNMLKVAQDNGVVTLYATPSPHPSRAPSARTTPSSCPHRGRRKSWTCRRASAPDSQGQLIGRVGNSGRSIGPASPRSQHQGWRCLSADLRAGAGDTLERRQCGHRQLDQLRRREDPRWRVLLWPAASPRRGIRPSPVPREDYGRLFLHLVDSGYEPVRFDGYSVGNRTFYNFVWRPASRPFRAWRDLSAATCQDRLEDALDDGFAPVHVESYRIGNSVRFALIVEKGCAGRVHLARHGWMRHSIRRCCSRPRTPASTRSTCPSSR
ncbi:MAG: hypothetical protein R3D28_21250 [Geminicoccaceae bacterium]